MPKITLDQSNLFSDKVGLNGLETLEFFAWEKKIKEIISVIKKEAAKDLIGWTKLPFAIEELKNIVKFTKNESKKWKNVVVLGIGGSALGLIALQKALGAKLNLIVLDNIDPDFFTRKLENLDWSQTLVIVISKSGTTPETMAQFYIIRDILKHEIKKDYHKHIIAITDENSGELHGLAITEDYQRFAIPSNVGGRFSVLSNVGLVPAGIAGIDITELCEGATLIEEDCFEESLNKNPAARLALAAYLLEKKKKKNIHIVCAYSNHLTGMVDWYMQLLAESIGKNEQTGLTPVRALGATDQHSQLQLWNTGPNDKVITFLEIHNFKNSIPIPYFDNEKLDYLSGKSLNELIRAEKKGTEMALTKNNRPNQTILIPRLNEKTLGQLFYLFEMQIAILGKLYEVDAYNQPGVEAGKEITKRLMQGINLRN